MLTLLGNLGLDGVDIDWEYPADAAQAADMVLLLKEVRQTLSPSNYTVSVAAPGPFGYTYLLLAEMDQYVDMWNLMAYDYVGNWSNLTGDLANLFSSTDHPASTPFSTDSIVKYYTSQGIPPTKIVLGMPLYGRYFNRTRGLGQPFSGSGTYSTKDLPLPGSTVYYDCQTGSSYSYNTAMEQLISYDNLAVAKQKATFIQNMLGGVGYWEVSEDGIGDASTIRSVTGVLRENGSDIDHTLNKLSFPNSSYENVRRGMPELGSTSTSATRTLTATSLAAQSETPVPTTCTVGSMFFWCEGKFCACVFDPSHNPSCLVIQSYCYNALCSTGSDCASDEICWVDNPCVDGAHCVQVVPRGCLDDPVQ